MIVAPPLPSSARVVAVTGGIGSGKSTVVKLFEEWGAAVVRADELAREATSRDSDGLRAIENTFGAEFITADGTLDRKKLGAVVFTDSAQRKALEAILHPIIRHLWLERLAHLQQDPRVGLIVYEVPLLFESGQTYPEINDILLVTAPQERRIERVAQRDGSSREQILARIASQMSDDEKARRSSYVIANAGSLEDLRTTCRHVFDTLIQSRSLK
jgi:dephospho-CoA kinase